MFPFITNSQLPQVVGCLMVTTYEDGENRCLLLPTVVLVEALHEPILHWNSHTAQVFGITHSLHNNKIAQELSSNVVFYSET